MTDPHYPEGIRAFDNDPRSPFFDDSLQVKMQEEIDEEIEDIRRERIADALKLLLTGSNAAIGLVAESIECSDFSRVLCTALAGAMEGQKGAAEYVGRNLVRIIQEFAVGDEHDLRDEAAGNVEARYTQEPEPGGYE